VKLERNSMTTTTTEREPAFLRALWSVVLIGVASGVAGFFLGGVRTGVSVLLGAAVAAVNLWAIRVIGRGLMSRQKTAVPWSVIAALKFAALLLGLYLVVKSHWVEILPLLIGYGALPLGIAFGQMGVVKPLGERS
jgi:hypothetical protein